MALVRALGDDEESAAWFEDYSRALTVINNSRSSHSFPLNSLQVNLRHIARRVFDGSLIAQRIKRLASIELKLKRFKTIRLSQMQDIGGCRAVVRSGSRCGPYRRGIPEQPLET